MRPQSHKNVSLFFIFVGVIIFITLQGAFFCQKPKRIEEPSSIKPVVKVKKEQEGKQPKVPLPRIKGSKGAVAIVLDDWGYNKSHCRDLYGIKVPLGIAILPQLNYSKEVVACSLDAGKEPMLHLPLEAKNAKNNQGYPKGYILKTEMSASEIRKDLVDMLQELKGVVGVNNHMGSKATEDKELMTVVLSEVKRQKLFFIDSMTAPATTSLSVAKALHMRIGKRDVFLDNKNERAYIEKQFEHAFHIAKDKGHVLIIGHDRSLTLKILKEQTDKKLQEGYEFITVKEYIRRYGYPRD